MKSKQTTSIKLVQIGRSGKPVESVGTLNKMAKEVCEALADLYQSGGFAPPWVGYLGVWEEKVVGTCAFKSPPAGGQVEIAYFTFPDYEKRGFATIMARQLIAIAQGAEPGMEIIAQTLPEKNASNAILTKLGFEFQGEVIHPEDGKVWQWKL